MAKGPPIGRSVKGQGQRAKPPRSFIQAEADAGPPNRAQRRLPLQPPDEDGGYRFAQSRGEDDDGDERPRGRGRPPQGGRPQGPRPQGMGGPPGRPDRNGPRPGGFRSGGPGGFGGERGPRDDRPSPDGDRRGGGRPMPGGPPGRPVGGRPGPGRPARATTVWRPSVHAAPRRRCPSSACCLQSGAAWAGAPGPAAFCVLTTTSGPRSGGHSGDW